MFGRQPLYQIDLPVMEAVCWRESGLARAEQMPYLSATELSVKGTGFDKRCQQTGT
jgi:hypothetical protein